MQMGVQFHVPGGTIGGTFNGCILLAGRPGYAKVVLWRKEWKRGWIQIDEDCLLW